MKRQIRLIEFPSRMVETKQRAEQQEKSLTFNYAKAEVEAGKKGKAER